MAEGALRIGVLCNSLQLQRWQLQSLQKLVEVPGVKLCVVVMNVPGEAIAKPALHAWSTALYRFYRHRVWKPSAMEVVDAAELLGGLPRVECRTVKQGIGEEFLPEDLVRISFHTPDILLRFGFNILRGGILSLPRHGVWSFHHGDEMKYRGGPPGLWEVMNGDPITGAMLQRLTDKLDAGHILRKGWFQTVDHSLEQTVDTVLMHSAIWPAQVCQELLLGNTQAALGRESPSEGRLYKYPRNLDFLRFLWKQWRNKVRFHGKELNEHEEWNIGVYHQPISTLLRDGHNTSVQWLPAPAAGQYRADPFGYYLDGALHVLYERYDQAEGQARIARLRPKQDNNLKRSRTMLDLGKHLSYPYIVEEAGQVFVVPEQAALGRVDLYRLIGTNEGLEPVANLLNEPLLDPTLFKHEGRWWLLGTKPPLTNVELFCYWSEAIGGPFLPHVLNPVKADIRSARPAGTPFVHEGQLWRPGQDSSLTYGGRISLNRVLELSPTAFVEETVKQIGSLTGRWSKGLHTISAAGDVALVAGKRFVTDPDQRRRVRGRKISGLFGNRGGKRKSGH